MYLKNENELSELLELDATSSASHVILNDRFEPGTRPRDEAALPLSTVLKHVLAGKTNSFTALVGWFGHSGSLEEGAGESPAKIILDEAKDRRDTLRFDTGATSTFRLLIGVNCSPAACDASRAWYWLCRFRHRSSAHHKQTDNLRREFLDAASDGKFLEASRRLVAAIRPSADIRPFEHCPFDGHDATSFAALLELEERETRAIVQEALAETIYLESDRNQRQRAGLFDDNAAILLGFLLQRSGDFRINPKTGGQATRVFHPKIYVVERTPAEQAAQTVSIVGSHNWTASAFGSESNDGVDSNVEVATFHVDAGLQWATGSPATLGHRVCGTARQLFSDAQYFLGYWNEPGDITDSDRPELLPADRLVGVTREVRDFKIPPASEQSSAGQFPPAMRRLAPHLKRFAERLIGMGGNGDDSSSLVNAWDQYRRCFEDADNPPFGYTPAPYQSDAAFRLLAMLGMTPTGGNGPRGGFLTDETGLGKTIVGLMVATCWIVERLKERATFERRKEQPIALRASFVVPARLAGEVQERSGWRGHCDDVEHLVRQLLEEQIDVTQNKNSWSLDALMALLDLRVYSIGAFSRVLFGEDDPSNFGPGEKNPLKLTLNEDIADDFLHVALSEVVVVDESHNFRNAGSRRTRTFRFLCSLPLPGEADWPLELGPGLDDDDDDSDDQDSATQRHFKARRRMLCLSATPFNNEVSDLTTQIGHFDQYQYWGTAYQSFSDGMPTELADALRTWRQAPATGDADKLRESFYQLLRYVGRHLYSGRRLSPKADDMPEKGDELQLGQPSDYGPYYLWRRDNNQKDGEFAYVKNLRVVEEWARSQSKQLEQADGDQLEADQIQENLTEKHLAQERMDALLVKLFVQRSRARVLRMSRASQDRGSDDPDSHDEPAGELFRKPTIPRYPIALNEGPDRGQSSRGPGKQGSSEFEREILAKLYRLLGEDDKKVTEQRDTLSFTSYSISIGRSRGQGAAEHNFLGFQLTGLVKRLQSSPYAFFRTIVRGTLRHALGELALVEQLLEDIDEQRIELGPKHLLERERDVLRDALEKARNALTGYFESVLEPVAEVLGGRWIDGYEADKRFFRALSGSEEKTSADRIRHQEFAATVEVAHKALDGQQELTGTEHGWLRDLVADVKRIVENQEPSGLFNDITTILTWLMGKPGSPGLQKQLFDHIDRRGENYAQLGEIRQRAAELVAGVDIEFDEQRRKAYGQWVYGRLQDDPRLRSLIAWLLIQAQARRANAAADDGGSKLRSGTRSLVFTEYTDTQEYLLAAFSAMGALFWPFADQQTDDARRLRDIKSVAGHVSDLLGEEVHKVARRLEAWTDTVQQQAHDDDSAHVQTFTQAQEYHSPIVFGAADDEQALPDWLGPLARGDLHEIAAAVREMCLKTGRICSGNGSGDAKPLFPGGARSSRGTSRGTPREQDSSQEIGVFADDDAGIEGFEIDDDALVGDHAIVDAFSPWYQIEPRENYQVDRGGQAGDQSEVLIEDCRRLAAAGKNSIDALITTEVLAEGVNLQECGVVIHYDLPWNPTRLIQRNGRVDRRINPNYEDSDKRQALLDNLLEAVQAYNDHLARDASSEQPIELVPNDIPTFHKPDQIYHMTVVPPEPQLDDVDDDRLVRRVRQRIFVKLETIRSLFGLSTWPVVLDRETARRVLSGELDYETPGFRRREELFSAWRQLQDVVDEHEIDDEHHSSGDFLIDVDTDFAARLGAATAGSIAQPATSPDQSPDTVQARWKRRLAGAALIQSSEYVPSVRVARLPANGHAGYLSGVYFLGSEQAPKIHRRCRPGWKRS